MDADLMEFCECVAEEEEQAEDFRICLPRRFIRDIQNPIEKFRDHEFHRRYRFEKKTVVEYLYPMVNSFLKTDRRGLPIPAMMKLLTALRFYATGLYQRDNGDIHGVNQSSVCKIISDVSKIFARKVKDYVKIPETPEERKQIQNKFYSIARVPGVIGCVDGTHIKIESPGGPNAEVFRNRKTFFSINVQVLAGPDQEILDIIVRYPGSYHDARIFRLSGLGIPFEGGRIRGVMLGDSGYPYISPHPSVDPKD